MRARICDRCSKSYNSYNEANSIKKPNSLMLLNTDMNDKYFTHNVIDLCPECMTELLKFLHLKGAAKNE